MSIAPTPHDRWRVREINEMTEDDLRFICKEYDLRFEDYHTMSLLKDTLKRYFHTNESYFRCSHRRLVAHREAKKVEALSARIQSSDLKDDALLAQIIKDKLGSLYGIIDY